KLVQRRDGTGGHGVALERSVVLLGTPALDLDVRQVEILGDLREPRATPLHRLDQVDLGLGAHGRDDDTRKTRTGTDVRNQTRHRKKGHHGSGVEDVAVPDARHLTWTDESPQFSLVTEPLGESIDR